MGTLRYILAVLVLVSHAGVNISGRHPGVVAVVVFYLISGYVMAALIARHYRAPRDLPRFYADRLLRIYPQYLLYASLTALWYAATATHTAFLQHPPTLQDVANNLLVLPLNYFMFNGADQFTLIPPAWSLGAELSFYLLAPWLWRHIRCAALLGVASFGIELAAWQGLLPTDAWGYRLLPGVLWVFLLGMFLHRAHQAPQTKRALTLVASCLVCIGAALLIVGPARAFERNYTFEVVCGVLLGYPLVAFLAVRRSRPFAPPWAARLDEHLGNISYGVFLNHFLLFWLFGLQAPGISLVFFVMGSTLLSAISHRWVETPVLHLRRYIRKHPY